VTDLEGRADELDDTSARDHALTVSIAGLSAVPVVGGVIATFVSEYVPRQKQQRLVALVQDLTREFVAQQDWIDQEYVRTKDFARMVEDVLDRAQAVRNEEKLGLWARLVAGAAQVDRPSRPETERMIETLDGIRPDQLPLLHVIATTNEPPPGLYMGGVFSTIEWKLPGTTQDEARRIWAELNRLDLVGSYPSGTMSAQGAGNLMAHMTPYGRSFVRTLHLESVTDEPE
jgi:hypothetical protein